MELMQDCVHYDLKQKTFAKEPLPPPSVEPITHQMSAAEVSKPTILDYLNEDCWWAVFNYVPVKDLIRSERACRQWQDVVLAYLQSVHVNIVTDHDLTNLTDLPPKVRTVRLPYKDIDESFESWTKKLGSSVLAATCQNKHIYEIMSNNCPNLEAVMFVELRQSLLKHLSEKFKRLPKLHFYECVVSDRCIKQFMISNHILEELAVYNGDHVTGQCLTSIRSAKFKSIIFYECQSLSFHHLLAAADRLPGLTKLDLDAVPRRIYNKIHLLLKHMPGLEYLNVNTCNKFGMEMRNERYIECVCRLGRLKHLVLNYDATDEDVEAVAKSCTELRHLELMECRELTSLGVSSACRWAGARLVTLTVTRLALVNDDAAAVVQHCPNLKTLTLRDCLTLTSALLPLMAAARRSHGARAPLTVYIGGNRVWAERRGLSNDNYKELILNY